MVWTARENRGLTCPADPLLTGRLHRDAPLPERFQNRASLLDSDLLIAAGKSDEVASVARLHFLCLEALQMKALLREVHAGALDALQH